MATKQATVSFAARIQPRTGQVLEEYPHGLTLSGVRPWTLADARRYPQASKASPHEGWRLFVDGDGAVYLIAAEEWR